MKIKLAILLALALSGALLWFVRPLKTQAPPPPAGACDDSKRNLCYEVWASGAELSRTQSTCLSTGGAWAPTCPTTSEPLGACSFQVAADHSRKILFYPGSRELKDLKADCDQHKGQWTAR